MVATTQEGYLIPTYGATGISPSAGAEAGMAAIRAVETQREQTLTSRQARDVVNQDQRRTEEDRALAAAERARLEAARKKFAAGVAGLTPLGAETAAVPGSGVVAAPGAPRAGLSFGPDTPAMEPTTMGVQPLSFSPATVAPTYVPPGGARATVAARQQDTPLAARLAPVWAQLEQQGGLPQGYFRRLAEVESSLNPGARNPNSTASGLFQFLRSTAQAYNVQNPNDPMDATQGAARYTADSLRVLQQGLGRQPTAGELYLAHQQGPTGAVNLLRNPDQLASAVVGADAVRLNGGDPETMTAGAFADIWISKFEGASNSRRNVPPSSSDALAAAGITFSPAPTAGLTEPATTTAAPSITEVDPEATAFQQDIQGLLRQGDIAGAINRIETGLATGTYGPMGSPLGRAVGYFRDAPDEAARRTQVQQALQWFKNDQNAALLRNNPALIAQAAADPLGFVAEQTAAAPIQVRSPGGKVLELGTPAAPTAAPAAGVATTAAPTAAPAAGVATTAAPTAAPAAGVATTAAPAAGVATTRGTVASEILGLPRGASAPAPSQRVIDAGPARMSQEMQILAAQDAELALLQQYYVDMGSITEASSVQLKRIQLRSAHQALQGAQAVARMDMGDYSMAAGALSNATGAPIQIQPRADGTFNLLTNGQVYAEGLTAAELKAYVQQTTDEAYRAQRAAVADAMLAADIERGTAREQALLDVMTKAAELVLSGENERALEMLRQQGYKMGTDADGKIIMYTEDGRDMFVTDLSGTVPGAKGPVVTRIETGK